MSCDIVDRAAASATRQLSTMPTSRDTIASAALIRHWYGFGSGFASRAAYNGIPQGKRRHAKPRRSVRQQGGDTAHHFVIFQSHEETRGTQALPPHRDAADAASVVVAAKYQCSLRAQPVERLPLTARRHLHEARPQHVHVAGWGHHTTLLVLIERLGGHPRYRALQVRVRVVSHCDKRRTSIVKL